MERILFIKKFPTEIWKNIKYEVSETFQNCLEANFLNKIHTAIIK